MHLWMAAKVAALPDLKAATFAAIQRCIAFFFIPDSQLLRILVEIAGSK
jgi:hypothetical protein